MGYVIVCAEYIGVSLRNNTPAGSWQWLFFDHVADESSSAAAAAVVAAEIVSVFCCAC